MSDVLGYRIVAVKACPTCEGSRNVGEPGFTYYGIPEPGSYEACPDCMDEHAIPTGTRLVDTGITVERTTVEVGVYDLAVWREIPDA